MDRDLFKAIIIVVFVLIGAKWAIGFTISSDYTEIGPSGNRSIAFNAVAGNTLLDGVTATGAGSGMTVDGQNQHTVYVTVASGTATVKFQCSPDAGTTWYDMATIASGDSYHFNFNADQCRGNVTACSSCDVDMTLKSIVR